LHRSQSFEDGKRACEVADDASGPAVCTHLHLAVLEVIAPLEQGLEVESGDAQLLLRATVRADAQQNEEDV